MKYLSNALNIFKIHLNIIHQCNSASLFIGCAHRDKNKFLIALPIDAENVRVFEETLMEDLAE